MNDFEELGKLIQKGSFDAVEIKVSEMLKQDIHPHEIIDKGIAVSLDEVGEKFSTGECFLPEMMVAAKASQRALQVLKKSMQKTDRKVGTVAIGTVQGDAHDIGKNIVTMTMEAAGFDVIDLGVDVPPDKFIATIEENDVPVLALSCLLTTTMKAMEATVKSVRGTKIGKRIKIMIGGPPITKDFADAIGADYRAEGPYDAIRKIKEWL